MSAGLPEGESLPLKGKPTILFSKQITGSEIAFVHCMFSVGFFNVHYILCMFSDAFSNVHYILFFLAVRPYSLQEL